MSYALEIAVIKTIGNKTRLTTRETGNPTQAHWGLIINHLRIDAAALCGDEWVEVDSATFRLLDLQLLAIDGLPDHVIETLNELKELANDDRATVKIFAQLA